MQGAKKKLKKTTSKERSLMLMFGKCVCQKLNRNNQVYLRRGNLSIYIKIMTFTLTSGQNTFSLQSYKGEKRHSVNIACILEKYNQSEFELILQT